VFISASRRTDIPSCYSDWFYNRIKEGFVLVRNPMNFHRISRICLAPEVVDGIVFWTKNPAPMLGRLNELREYMYYFQFTLTPYGRDIEANIPPKNDAILSAFKRLSDRIGADRVLWRYDPLLISNTYSADYHVRAFTNIAEELHGYTRKVTTSFIGEDYRGVKNNISELALLPFPVETKIALSSKLAGIARDYGLTIDICAEKLDVQKYGIGRARCIDDRLFAKLLGCNVHIDRDKAQRRECCCASSIDIGMYNTCKNGCRYCYANYSVQAVAENSARHNPRSQLIAGDVCAEDTISEREVQSCRDKQMRLCGI